jgi:hypothetical protein
VEKAVIDRRNIGGVRAGCGKCSGCQYVAPIRKIKATELRGPLEAINGS